MIFTKEPANVFYVLVSAFRSNLDDEVNMSRHRHMVSTLRAAPGLYGSVESTDLTGCYREAIASAPTEEKTVRVRCKDKAQALNVARLACNEWEQDCVLVYKSQTHTAGLVYAKGIDGYKAERLPGSFQEVPKGAPLQGCFTIDEFGRRWQVANMNRYYINVPGWGGSLTCYGYNQRDARKRFREQHGFGRLPNGTRLWLDARDW